MMLFVVVCMASLAGYQAYNEQYALSQSTVAVMLGVILFDYFKYLINKRLVTLAKLTREHFVLKEDANKLLSTISKDMEELKDELSKLQSERT